MTITRRGWSRRVGALCAATVSARLLAPIGSARAHDYAIGDLRIEHPWTRAVAPTAPTAAGYMVIRNAGSVPDRLIAAETPAAARVELHEMTMTDSIMRMRPVPGGLPIPPSAELRLAPGGGLHLMLVGPRGGFTQGARLKLTLVFERAGRIEVELPVEAPGARAGSHEGH